MLVIAFKFYHYVTCNSLILVLLSTLVLVLLNLILNELTHFFCLCVIPTHSSILSFFVRNIHTRFYLLLQCFQSYSLLVRLELVTHTIRLTLEVGVCTCYLVVGFVLAEGLGKLL